MAASVLSARWFHDEEAAYRKLESILWPHGARCPRCGGSERITKVSGGRIGLWRCGPCKRQFRVTVRTVFESAHVRLPLWFQAMHLLCSSKKGMSSHQIHRVLGVTYKTAWFMTHRIREAMVPHEPLPEALGGEGKAIEIDATVAVSGSG
jgi:transposase-like protein